MLSVDREHVRAMKFGANDRFFYASFTQFLNHVNDILFTQHKQILPEEYHWSLYSGFAKEYLKNSPCYISYLRHSWKTYIVFHNLKPHSTALQALSGEACDRTRTRWHTPRLPRINFFLSSFLVANSHTYQHIRNQTWKFCLAVKNLCLDVLMKAKWIICWSSFNYF